jgi:K+-transporting ATPase ATPase C chain
MLRHQLRPAIVITVLMILITGIIYPGAVTAVAQIVFPRQANGSLVTSDGHIVGSALIGQSFSQPYYFHPRPSAAGSGYVGDSSSGTNKGPTDRKLADTLVAQAIDSAVAQDSAVKGRIPGDMVTSSASGLDPDISPENAAIQTLRVARARGVPPDRVQALVESHTAARQAGFFGEPRVNVLALNIALDSTFGRHP